MKKPKQSSRKFEPNNVERHGETTGFGDLRSGALYVYSDRIKLAVRVALATGRPLLVRGDPGWGKSSLAPAVAKYKGWRYVEKVISSRTQARELMSELDLVRRLSDAQAQGKVDADWRRYINPGVLWDAFDPLGAERQRRYFAQKETAADKSEASMEQPISPAVVLLDEMDKADPDVPNNLLVALGALQFDVEEIPQTVKARADAVPLIIITSNDERDLPRAFLRRCVEVTLPAFDGEDLNGSQRKALLVKIGAEHLQGQLKLTDVQRIADVVAPAGNDPVGVATALPSPAEFIDILRAVHELYGANAPTTDIAAVVAIAGRKPSFGAVG
ncbi:AAA family ATPase [Dongia sp.]|uniref:AAA family ATPase n=1 Tax=Dongia sp. TaxID=1977262 RepID=UPI0035B4F72C